MMMLIKISIPNWSKFNPRADRANYTWFRFQNDFFHDQKMFGLSDAQIILWQLLLCEASKNNAGEFDVNLDYLATFRKLAASKILIDLRELAKRGVIATADGRLNDGEEPALLPATYERTNVRTTVRKSVDLPPIATDWNTTTKRNPKIKIWSEHRSSLGEKILEEFGAEKFHEACIKVEASEFLSGRNGKWKRGATFDWIIKRDNFIKVIEGNYDNESTSVRIVL